MEIVTLRERPELREALFSAAFDRAWPEFMRHDPAGRFYFWPPHLDRYVDFVLVGLAGGKVVARGMSVPFALGAAGREELPDAGWDAVILWANDDHAAGRKPNAVSALDITLLPQARGQGNSRRMLEAMRANTRRLGFSDLYAPVRPNAKHTVPLTPMADYIAEAIDGLPRDPWLRTHIRAGASIVKVAPFSMTIAGTLAEWEAWTGSRFTRSGRTVVPGALAPVHVCVEEDYAVYVEPNVWVRHPV